MLNLAVDACKFFTASVAKNINLDAKAVEDVFHSETFPCATRTALLFLYQTQNAHAVECYRILDRTHVYTTLPICDLFTLHTNILYTYLQIA